MPSPSDLTEVLSKPQVKTEELTPFLEKLLRNDPVPTEPVGLVEEGKTEVQGLFSPPKNLLDGTFSDPAWWAYQRVWGVHWTREGRFMNCPPTLDVPGGREYIFRQSQEKPFAFVRYSGEIITPSSMRTDGGSIPRIAWAIPGLNPWDYMPAFLVHDYDFMAHHCIPDYNRSFSEVNDTLGEAIYTMMKTGMVSQDWRVLAAIHVGCSSFIGRRVWGREWSPAQCQFVLDPKV